MENYLEKCDYFNIELPKTEKILDWREHTIMYWIRLGEDIYGDNVNLAQTKKLLLEELKFEENPQYLDEILEGLVKENLIAINENLISIVKGE